MRMRRETKQSQSNFDYENKLTIFQLKTEIKLEL